MCKHQGLIDPRSGERSAYACRDGKLWWLPNAWAGGKGSCAVCIDLQAVGTLEFFGELHSLAKGPTITLQDRQLLGSNSPTLGEAVPTRGRKTIKHLINLAVGLYNYIIVRPSNLPFLET